MVASKPGQTHAISFQSHSKLSVLLLAPTPGPGCDAAPAGTRCSTSRCAPTGHHGASWEPGGGGGHGRRGLRLRVQEVRQVPYRTLASSPIEIHAGGRARAEARPGRARARARHRRAARHVLRALASTQNDSFFFFFLLSVSSSPSPICAAASSSSSSPIQFNSIPLRGLAPGHPSGAAAAGVAVQLAPARVAPPGLAAIRCNPDSLPLQNSSSHVRGSRGPRGLGFMALVNPWRAVPRSPCRFFFNAR